MNFPIITTTKAAVTIPAVPAVPEIHAGNVRFSSSKPCWFRPIWSGGTLSGVEGEWFWEVGAWDQTGTIWTPSGAPEVNHHEANLLDPTFASTYPEVAAMGQAFVAMASISTKKGVI